MSYPNQKTVKINKSKATGNFLQVGKNEWQEASKKLTYCAFKLYLYLAGNADGFKLGLSPQAIENAIEMSNSSYHKVKKELISYGYLVEEEGNIYSFYTTPLHDSQSLAVNSKVHSGNIEINNIDNIDNIDIDYKYNNISNKIKIYISSSKNKIDMSEYQELIADTKYEIPILDLENEFLTDLEYKFKNDIIGIVVKIQDRTIEDEYWNYESYWRKQGKTYFWLLTSLCSRKTEYWKENGFDIYYQGDFLLEIDSIVLEEEKKNEMLKKHQDIAREIYIERGTFLSA